MRYCVRLPNSGPFASREAITLVATTADRLGYDAVSTHDHVNWGYADRYHNYCGSSEAVDARGGPSDFYEVFATLCYLAGITKQIKLIPDSLCLAWRPIVLFARQALTLHQLSKGRFVLCVGAGNVHRDFEITGTPFEERLPISLEKLKVLRMLIDQPGLLTFEGKYVRFKDAELTPQPQALPLWYAGGGDIALKRAARYCEGWMPSGTPERFRQRIPDLLHEAELAGRGNVSFEIATLLCTCVAPTDEEAWKTARRTIEDRADPAKGEWLTHYSSSHQETNRESQKMMIGSPETLAGAVRDYEAAGVTQLQLGFTGHSVESILEQMEMFTREVKPLVES